MRYKPSSKPFLHSFILVFFGGLSIAFLLYILHPVIIKSPKLKPVVTQKPTTANPQVLILDRTAKLDSYLSYDIATFGAKLLYQEPSHGSNFSAEMMEGDKVFIASSIDYRKLNLNTNQTITLGKVIYRTYQNPVWNPSEHKIDYVPNQILVSPIAMTSPTGLYTLYMPPTLTTSLLQFSIINNETKIASKAAISDYSHLYPTTVGWSNNESDYYFTFFNLSLFNSRTTLYDLNIANSNITAFHFDPSIPPIKGIFWNNSQNRFYLPTSDGLYYQDNDSKEATKTAVPVEDLADVQSLIFSNDPNNINIVLQTKNSLELVNTQTDTPELIYHTSPSQQLLNAIWKNNDVVYIITESSSVNEKVYKGLAYNLVMQSTSQFLSTSSAHIISLLGFLDN